MVSICHTPSPPSGGWRNMWTAPYVHTSIVLKSIWGHFWIGHNSLRYRTQHVNSVDVQRALNCYMESRQRNVIQIFFLIWVKIFGPNKFGWTYLAHPEAAKKMWSGLIQSCRNGLNLVINKTWNGMLEDINIKWSWNSDGWEFVDLVINIF